MAFREYSTGERIKIKYPWVTIIISGILVAVAMILTNWLGTALHEILILSTLFWLYMVYLLVLLVHGETIQIVLLLH